MSGNSALEAMRQTHFFDGFGDAHIEKLAPIAQAVEFPARHTIFQEKEKARHVYVIVRGRVSLAICLPKVGCRQLMEVRDGELIGWSPLGGQVRLSDTATTVEPTTVLAFDGSDLLAACDADKDLGYEFMRRTAHVLATRLAATRLQLLDAYGTRLPRIVVDTD